MTTTTATTDPIAAAVEPVADDILAAIPTPAGKTWYTINNKAEADDEVEAEVMIYDEIGGWGIGASQFVRDFKAIDAGRIRLRINSPGGAVTEAVAMFNAIREHKARIIAHVDGLAASAASVIAMAGDEVRMADNAYLMIHEAHGGVMGDAADFQRYADLLAKMNDNIAGAYQKKSGKPKSHWRKLMADETWFTAKEAKAEGLVDAVYVADKPLKETASASFDFTIYNRVPAEVLAAFQANQTTAPEASSCDDPPPAVPLQEPITMATETTQAAPAQNSAAGSASQVSQSEVVRLNDQAVQGYIDRGRALGAAEGRQSEQDRLRRLMAVCPGKPGIAVNAFLSGHDESMIRMLVDAETRAEAAAREKTAQMEVEIARLNAQIATGGHPGVSFSVSSTPAGGPVTAVPSGMTPEAQADLEWESDPMIRAQHKESTWKRYRVQQLSGNVRVLAKTA